MISLQSDQNEGNHDEIVQIKISIINMVKIKIIIV